jgi:hypothetical protein
MVEKQEVTVVAVSLCNIIRRYIEDLENSGRQRKGRSEFFLFGKIIIIIIIIIIILIIIYKKVIDSISITAKFNIVITRTDCFIKKSEKFN